MPVDHQAALAGTSHLGMAPNEPDRASNTQQMVQQNQSFSLLDQITQKIIKFKNNPAAATSNTVSQQTQPVQPFLIQPINRIQQTVPISTLGLFSRSPHYEPQKQFGVITPTMSHGNQSGGSAESQRELAHHL